MLQIGKSLVSDDILEKHFVCDLQACKGACCVEGQAGAPLEEEELQVLDELFPKMKPFLRKEGIAAIETQGTYVKGSDGDWETPLIKKQECAYVVYDASGIAQCGIEKAHHAGAIDWQKPISCHLYPVRIKEYTELTAVNYHKWEICDPACKLGASLQVPIYKFVREALIRKFGESWYSELEALAAAH